MMEVELYALTEAASQAIFLRSNLAVLGETEESAISHRRMNHISVHKLYVRDLVAEGEVTVEHVAGKENAVDILTKTLRWKEFEKHQSGIEVYKEQD